MLIPTSPSTPRHATQCYQPRHTTSHDIPRPHHAPPPPYRNTQTLTHPKPHTHTMPSPYLTFSRRERKSGLPVCARLETSRVLPGIGILDAAGKPPKALAPMKSFEC